MTSSKTQYLYRLAIAGGVAALALFGVAACEEESPAGTNGEQDSDTINDEDSDDNGGGTY